MTWIGMLAAIAAIAVISAEIGARLAGLHRPLIYERTSYGYRVVPGQNARLLNRTASYDEHGLRSTPFSGQPGDGQLRILCIGDSITNGGLRVDQSETWPVLVQELLKLRGVDAQVLNASAGGWALENEAGWFAEYGTLHSQIVVFEVGTHDLWQPRSSEETVGTHPAFPDRPPRLALQAAFARYIKPRLSRMVIADPGTTGGEPTMADMQARLGVLRSMVAQARSQGATPMILHVEQPGEHELSTPTVIEAKQNLQSWVVSEGIAYMNTKDAVQRAGGSALFFDPYHPNVEGNRVISALVAEKLSPLR